jgi:hypothetical protein
MGAFYRGHNLTTFDGNYGSVPGASEGAGIIY